MRISGYKHGSQDAISKAHYLGSTRYPAPGEVITPDGGVTAGIARGARGGLAKPAAAGQLPRLPGASLLCLSALALEINQFRAGLMPNSQAGPADRSQYGPCSGGRSHSPSPSATAAGTGG